MILDASGNGNIRAVFIYEKKMLEHNLPLITALSSILCNRICKVICIVLRLVSIKEETKNKTLHDNYRHGI